MDVRDPIHGSIALSSAELKIIDSVAYQRLRAIKQLGFAELSFPGATHNRFLHSIGVCHLAGRIFDSALHNFKFGSSESTTRLRQCLKLAALLHDIGHGPLSHTTEEVMPPVKELNIPAYKNRRSDIEIEPMDNSRQANHEDYTIKFITDSSLSVIIRREFPQMDPIHVACLVDKSLLCPDDFFKEGGFDLRPILSQIISSEMDVDRMDYLERDAYFCGTSYGKVELDWLLANTTHHLVDDQVYLSLQRRALYTFDDFLLARHHMHLMVYFHHKSIIYEELLYRYLTSKDCHYKIPSQIEEYIHCTDYGFYQHLTQVDNLWARRIADQIPYQRLFEWHFVETSSPRTKKMKEILASEGIDTIASNSKARLSKCHSSHPIEKSFPIYVVDPYDIGGQPHSIQESTEIFSKYEEIRSIDRLYVAPENLEKSKQILVDRGL